MLGNYLKTTMRSVQGNGLYTVINVCGLALGLLCFLLIMLFVRYELSYDGFFPNSDSIYRISPDYRESSFGPERHSAGNVAAFAPFVRGKGLDGVSHMARIGGQHALIARDDLVFYEENFRWADEEIFDIFRFDWLRGTAAGSLEQPFSVVLSEKMAHKLFGRIDVLGETLRLENAWTLTVTGVIADIPDNSHLGADLIVGMDTAWAVLDFDYSNNWFYTNFHTYVSLEQGASIDDVMQQLHDVAVNASTIPMLEEGALEFSAEALTGIHLYSSREGSFRESGSLGFVLTFSAIAACLLLIACINFTNLSTARASMRAKEVGLRKTIGAARSQLIAQFLGEAFLYTCTALLVALALAEVLLPVFSAVVERPLQFATLFDPEFLPLIVTLTIVTALIAGAHPAFYLSGFNPTRVLRPAAGTFASGAHLRNILVVLQFFLAITLIVATLVVYLQMQFVRSQELGFRRDGVVVLWGTHKDGLGAQWSSLKEELKQQPGIVDIAEADMYPGSAATRLFRAEGGTPEGVNMLAKRIGFNFFETYDIEVLAGRSFNEHLTSDLFLPPPNVERGVQPTGAYVLNATAARALGWSPAQAIGKQLEMDFSNDFSLTVAGPIVGVVEDIHLASLREPIRPLVYHVPPQNWGALPSFDIASVRIQGDVTQALTAIDNAWRKFNPEIPLLRHFLDEDFEALYRDEERQGQLFSLFALLTVGLACLGLLGLASFTVERRRKEIGVRKVMGGSVWGIVLLLTNDFSRLVLLANVLAWPVAWFAMNNWLQGFAYRIDLTPLVFIGSGLIALCIAWVTVGSTAAKAASAKPVLALRYE